METITRILFVFLPFALTAIAGFTDYFPKSGTLNDFRFNVSYGSHPEQNFDAYLLGDGQWSDVEKVILLIHGGGWSAGTKEDFNYILPFFATHFPTYGIVNMNYRLGTEESPGYPKQLEDIQSVVNWIQGEAGYDVRLALVGGSAGAHLAMLYAYRYELN